MGVYLFDDSILEACASLSPSWRGEFEITEAIQWLIDHGKNVRAAMVGGWWKDTGKPDDLLEANRVMLAERSTEVRGEIDDESAVDGTAVVAEGAKVIRSQLRGPVVIGPDTVVEDSMIGPNVSVERGCTISRSTIEDSIVMEGCVLAAVRGLSGSILGRNVEVRHSGREGTHRLIVGDQSQVEVD